MLIPTTCFSDRSIRPCFGIIITQVFSLRKKNTLLKEQFRDYAALTCSGAVLQCYYRCFIKAWALVYIMEWTVNDTCIIYLSVSTNPSLRVIKISYFFFNHLPICRNKNVSCDHKKNNKILLKITEVSHCNKCPGKPGRTREL